MSDQITAASAPPKPELDLVLISYLEADTSALRFIKVGAGTQTNITMKGGRWEHPDGTVFARVIPGVGGDYGIVDSQGVFHVDGHGTLEFDDGKFGYLRATGHGTIQVGNVLNFNLVTDSEKYSHLAGKVLLAPSNIVGETIVSSVYLPKEHWKK